MRHNNFYGRQSQEIFYLKNGKDKARQRKRMNPLPATNIEKTFKFSLLQIVPMFCVGSTGYHRFAVKRGQLPVVASDFASLFSNVDRRLAMGRVQPIKLPSSLLIAITQDLGTESPPPGKWELPSSPGC